MANPTVFNNALVAVGTATGAVASVAIGGVKDVSWGLNRAELGDSVMGDTIEALYPGVYSIPISVTARQDFTTGAGSAAGNDLRFYTLLANKTAVPMKIRAVNASVSATNPSYILSKTYVVSVTPITGAWGAALENKIEFRPASGCTLTRSATT